MNRLIPPLRFFALCVVCARISPCTMLAQDAGLPSGVGGIIARDMQIALDDGVSFWSAPSRFSTRDWLIVGGVVGGTVSLVSLDGTLRTTLNRGTEEEYAHSFWCVSTGCGSMRCVGLLSAGLYVSGLVCGENGIRVTGRMILESLALSASVALPLRYCAGRVGPNGGSNPWEFRGFRWDNGGMFFPSGHAMTAFAAATVLAGQIDHPAAWISLYGISSLCAVSLVRFSSHWTSDVFIGSVLGVVAGLHVISRERGREGMSNGEFSIHPSPGGVQFVYTFH